MEEVVVVAAAAAHQDVNMGSKDQAHVAKGKRTKRQRLQSPIPFAITNNSVSQEEGGYVVDDCNFVAEDDCVVQNNTSFSPTTSAELQYTTEEEEDMANCLILLAQGRSPLSPKRVNTVDTGPFQLNHRRSLPETTVASGCYAYECKTCYRTFPSFQALGGHRASHKKPKAMAMAMMDEKKNFLSSDDEEVQFKTHSLSLQLNQRGNLYSSGKSKVHECAVCGAEFTSGQALGGHMRRHRAAPTGTNTALSLTPMVAMEAEDQRQPKKQRSMLSLDLDLNLPAPQDHDQRESKFFIKSNHHQQQQQQQPQHNNKQQALVFSTGTLVDCHY